MNYSPVRVPEGEKEKRISGRKTADVKVGRHKGAWCFQDRYFGAGIKEAGYREVEADEITMNYV